MYDIAAFSLNKLFSIYTNNFIFNVIIKLLKRDALVGFKLELVFRLSSLADFRPQSISGMLSAFTAADLRVDLFKLQLVINEQHYKWIHS